MDTSRLDVQMETEGEASSRKGNDNIEETCLQALEKASSDTEVLAALLLVASRPRLISAPFG